MERIVPEIIQPIKLLAGSHDDTATTGQGCFMNVIAYLNGEAQITDQSPCVCYMVRPLAIKLNDLGNDEKRQRLLPFVMRALGSATGDKAIIESRKQRIRAYGAECQQIINDWRTEMKAADAYVYAYAYADAYANAYANANANAYANAYANADAYADAYAYAYANANANADAYANAYANAYADANANANAYANAYAYAYADAYAKAWVQTQLKVKELKAKLFDAGLRYLDDVLPPADVPTSEVLARAERLCELAR